MKILRTLGIAAAIASLAFPSATAQTIPTGYADAILTDSDITLFAPKADETVRDSLEALHNRKAEDMLTDCTTDQVIASDGLGGTQCAAPGGGGGGAIDTVAADSGTPTNDANITIAGGDGITTSVLSDTITVDMDGPATNVAYDTDGDALPDFIRCGDFDGDGTLENIDDVQGCIDAITDNPSHVYVLPGEYQMPPLAGCDEIGEPCFDRLNATGSYGGADYCGTGNCGVIQIPDGMDFECSGPKSTFFVAWPYSADGDPLTTTVNLSHPMIANVTDSVDSTFSVRNCGIRGGANNTVADGGSGTPAASQPNADELVVTGAGWTTDEWFGGTVTYTDVNGKVESHPIESNTATTLTLKFGHTWADTPDENGSYTIQIYDDDAMVTAFRGIQLTDTKDVLIEGNYCEYFEHACYFADDSDGTVIRNNVAYRDGGWNGDGEDTKQASIYLNIDVTGVPTTMRDNVVEGNRVVQSGGNAINLRNDNALPSYMLNTLVRDNHVIEPRSAGINIRGQTDVSVYNLICERGGPCVSLAGASTNAWREDGSAYSNVGVTIDGVVARDIRPGNNLSAIYVPKFNEHVHLSNIDIAELNETSATPTLLNGIKVDSPQRDFLLDGYRGRALSSWGTAINLTVTAGFPFGASPQEQGVIRNVDLSELDNDLSSGTGTESVGVFVVGAGDAIKGWTFEGISIKGGTGYGFYFDPDVDVTDVTIRDFVYDGRMPRYLGDFQVSTLPTCDAEIEDHWGMVDDATGTTDCTTGGIGTINYCRCDGSAWTDVNYGAAKPAIDLASGTRTGLATGLLIDGAMITNVEGQGTGIHLGTNGSGDHADNRITNVTCVDNAVLYSAMGRCIDFDDGDTVTTAVDGIWCPGAQPSVCVDYGTGNTFAGPTIEDTTPVADTDALFFDVSSSTWKATEWIDSSVYLLSSWAYSKIGELFAAALGTPHDACDTGFVKGGGYNSTTGKWRWSCAAEASGLSYECTCDGVGAATCPGTATIGDQACQSASQVGETIIVNGVQDIMVAMDRTEKFGQVYLEEKVYLSRGCGEDLNGADNTCPKLTGLGIANPVRGLALVNGIQVIGRGRDDDGPERGGRFGTYIIHDTGEQTLNETDPNGGPPVLPVRHTVVGGIAQGGGNQCHGEGDDGSPTNWNAVYGRAECEITTVGGSPAYGSSSIINADINAWGVSMDLLAIDIAAGTICIEDELLCQLDPRIRCADNDTCNDVGGNDVGPCVESGVIFEDLVDTKGEHVFLHVEQDLDESDSDAEAVGADTGVVLRVDSVGAECQTSTGWTLTVSLGDGFQSELDTLEIGKKIGVISEVVGTGGELHGVTQVPLHYAGTNHTASGGPNCTAAEGVSGCDTSPVWATGATWFSGGGFFDSAQFYCSSIGQSCLDSYSGTPGQRPRIERNLFADGRMVISQFSDIGGGPIIKGNVFRQISDSLVTQAESLVSSVIKIWGDQAVLEDNLFIDNNVAAIVHHEWSARGTTFSNNRYLGNHAPTGVYNISAGEGVLIANDYVESNRGRYLTVMPKTTEGVYGLRVKDFRIVGRDNVSFGETSAIGGTPWPESEGLAVVVIGDSDDAAGFNGTISGVHIGPGYAKTDESDAVFAWFEGAATDTDNGAQNRDRVTIEGIDFHGGSGSLFAVAGGLNDAGDCGGDGCDATDSEDLWLSAYQPLMYSSKINGEPDIDLTDALRVRQYVHGVPTNGECNSVDFLAGQPDSFGVVNSTAAVERNNVYAQPWRIRRVSLSLTGANLAGNRSADLTVEIGDSSAEQTVVWDSKADASTKINYGPAACNGLGDHCDMILNKDLASLQWFRICADTDAEGDCETPACSHANANMTGYFETTLVR